MWKFICQYTFKEANLKYQEVHHSEMI